VVACDCRLRLGDKTRTKFEEKAAATGESDARDTALNRGRGDDVSGGGSLKKLYVSVLVQRWTVLTSVHGAVGWTSAW